MIFGFPDAWITVIRLVISGDLARSSSFAWVPGSTALQHLVDVSRFAGSIAGAANPDLYRHGIHAKEFMVNVTVGPGGYHVRLKFAADRSRDSFRGGITIAIYGKDVVRNMDVTATGRRTEPGHRPRIQRDRAAKWRDRHSFPGRRDRRGFPARLRSGDRGWTRPRGGFGVEAVATRRRKPVAAVYDERSFSATDETPFE